MPKENQNIFYQNIADVLAQWSVPVKPWATQLVEQINQGTMQWQQMMENGRSLHLLRVYAPIIQREEVFLGNVLLNDFFFKAIPTAAQRIGLMQFSSVANDLESAYFLAYGELDNDQLKQSFLDVLTARLPDLFFADDNPGKGIHGQFNTMLTFYKANIEPFPVFAIPALLLPDLLKRVAEWLRLITSADGTYELAKIEHLPFEVAASRRINVILSLLSFFFCRDGAEMQSFYKFLEKGITDGRFPSSQIKQAFGIPAEQPFNKKQFNDAKQKSESLDFDALERAVAAFLDASIIELEQKENSVEQFYLTTKMLPYTLQEMVASLTHDLQIGYTTLVDPNTASNKTMCRLSGQNIAAIQECHIIGGVNTGKRFNQSLKREAYRFSIHTGLAAYLGNKRLGMQFDGGFPIPKMYNVFFHYGQHSDDEREVFQRQLDYLIEYAAKTERTIPELDTGLKQIRRRALNERNLEDFSDVLGEWDEAALETIAQLASGAKAQVLALGSGFYRLFIFILPQFRPGSEEGVDFVQKRVSHSRLAAFTLLALLRGLCGSDGPYYYQSLPHLSNGVEADIFYVQNRPERASKALKKYGAIVSFARQVSRYRKGHSLLADWILLAERLLEDPLGVFSDVLRDSPIRVGYDFTNSNAKYKRLSSDLDAARGLGVVDSTEYIALYEQLHELAKEID